MEEKEEKDDKKEKKVNNTFINLTKVFDDNVIYSLEHKKVFAVLKEIENKKIKKISTDPNAKNVLLITFENNEKWAVVIPAEVPSEIVEKIKNKFFDKKEPVINFNIVNILQGWEKEWKKETNL